MKSSLNYTVQIELEKLERRVVRKNINNLNQEIFEAISGAKKRQRISREQQSYFRKLYEEEQKSLRKRQLVITVISYFLAASFMLFISIFSYFLIRDYLANNSMEFSFMESVFNWFFNCYFFIESLYSNYFLADFSGRKYFDKGLVDNLNWGL